MKAGFFLASVCCLGAVASAWTAAPATPSTASRRDFLGRAVKIVPLVVLPAPGLAEDEAPAPEAVDEAVPPPPAGDDNDFVARLKAQSDAKREEYARAARSSDKLSRRQFSSQYERPSYVGVHAAGGGTVTMVLRAEIEGMLTSGEVVKTYEPRMNKEGEVADDYSKPIFAFAR